VSGEGQGHYKERLLYHSKTSTVSGVAVIITSRAHFGNFQLGGNFLLYFKGVKPPPPAPSGYNTC